MASRSSIEFRRVQSLLSNYYANLDNNIACFVPRGNVVISRMAEEIIVSVIKLVAQDCDTAIDIGCGQNWIKDLIDCTVTGVDFGGTSHPFFQSESYRLQLKQGIKPKILSDRADIHAELGDEWFQSHQLKYDCAFALLLIHYRCFDEIMSAIDDVMSMCTKRAYITLNTKRIIDHAQEHYYSTRKKDYIKRNNNFVKMLNTTASNFDQKFVEWIQENSTHNMTRSFLFTHEGKDAGLHASIHMVFEK